MSMKTVKRVCASLVIGVVLPLGVVGISGSGVQAAAAAAPAPSVVISGLGFGSTISPGTQIRVVTNSSVVRVEYSIGAISYTGLVETYLGNSTTAPYSFTWNGYPSSIDVGSRPELVVRAFDARDRVAEVRLPVVVPGSVNSRVSRARNVAASAYWTVQNLNGASLAGIGFNSVVRGVTRLDNPGEAGVFTVNANVAGTYQITVNQYVLSGTKPAFSVAVNDQVVAPSLPGVRTATAWNNFGAADVNRSGTTTIVANLTQGANRVKVTSLSAGILNIGSVLIAQPGI